MDAMQLSVPIEKQIVPGKMDFISRSEEDSKPGMFIAEHNRVPAT